MKIAGACIFAGLFLALVAGLLPGILRLLLMLLVVVVVGVGTALTFWSEILCLQAPTRWQGRRWIVGLIVSQVIIAFGATLVLPEYHRIWSGLWGLAATAAMYLYLNDLSSEFGRPDVPGVLRRFAIYSTVGACAMGAARELQPQQWVFGLVLAAAFICLNQGVRAYLSALTELRTTLLAIDALSQSEGSALLLDDMAEPAGS
jgi:hypothetical protein